MPVNKKKATDRKHNDLLEDVNLLLERFNRLVNRRIVDRKEASNMLQSIISAVRGPDVYFDETNCVSDGTLKSSTAGLIRKLVFPNYGGTIYGGPDTSINYHDVLHSPEVIKSFKVMRRISGSDHFEKHCIDAIYSLEQLEACESSLTKHKSK